MLVNYFNYWEECMCSANVTKWNQIDGNHVQLTASIVNYGIRESPPQLVSVILSKYQYRCNVVRRHHTSHNSKLQSRLNKRLTTQSPLVISPISQFFELFLIAACALVVEGRIFSGRNMEQINKLALNRKSLSSRSKLKRSSKLNFEIMDTFSEVANVFVGRSIPDVSDFYALLNNVGVSDTVELDEIQQKKRHKTDVANDIRIINMSNAAQSGYGSANFQQEDLSVLDSTIARFIHCIRIVYAEATHSILKYLQVYLYVSVLSLNVECTLIIAFAAVSDRFCEESLQSRAAQRHLVD